MKSQRLFSHSCFGLVVDMRTGRSSPNAEQDRAGLGPEPYGPKGDITSSRLKQDGHVNPKFLIKLT